MVIILPAHGTRYLEVRLAATDGRGRGWLLGHPVLLLRIVTSSGSGLKLRNIVLVDDSRNRNPPATACSALGDGRAGPGNYIRRNGYTSKSGAATD
jgi:hypothetical protein